MRMLILDSYLACIGGGLMDAEEQKLRSHYAHHEAGHVVIAILSRFRVSEAWIKSDNEGIYCGNTTIEATRLVYVSLDGTERQESHQQALRRRLLVDLAGIASEHVFFGECVNGAQIGDIRAASEKILKLAKGDPQKYMNKVLSETIKMIEADHSVVSAVAKKIFDNGQISAGEIALLVEGR